MMEESNKENFDISKELEKNQGGEQDQSSAAPATQQVQPPLIAPAPPSQSHNTESTAKPHKHEFNTSWPEDLEVDEQFSTESYKFFLPYEHILWKLKLLYQSHYSILKNHQSYYFKSFQSYCNCCIIFSKPFQSFHTSAWLYQLFAIILKKKCNQAEDGTIAS